MEIGGLREQPCHANEGDVAAPQRVHEAVVECRERRVHLGGQRRLPEHGWHRQVVSNRSADALGEAAEGIHRPCIHDSGQWLCRRVGGGAVGHEPRWGRRLRDPNRGQLEGVTDVRVGRIRNPNRGQLEGVANLRVGWIAVRFRTSGRGRQLCDGFC